MLGEGEGVVEKGSWDGSGEEFPDGMTIQDGLLESALGWV